MKRNIVSLLLIVLNGLVMFSCHKNIVTAAPVQDNTPIHGLYTLNGGTNDTSILSFYNLTSRKLTADQYFAANMQALGTGGNDIEIYGAKMYIVLTSRSVVNIIDARTGKLIKQDSLLVPNAMPMYGCKSPRRITFYKDKAYVSCHDGTIVTIDTLSSSVISSITIPRQFFLEGIVVANNKLYVADNEAGRDTTVSVIDLASGKVVKTINTIPSPESLVADNYGNVYVLSNFTDDWRGFYVNPGGLTIIDSKTDTVKLMLPSIKKWVFPRAPMIINGDLVYYMSEGNNIAVFNAKTQTQVTANFITDGSAIQYPNALCIDSVTGEVYVGDARDQSGNGVVDVFDKTGKLEYSFDTGGLPVKLKLLN